MLGNHRNSQKNNQPPYVSGSASIENKIIISKINEITSQQFVSTLVILQSRFSGSNESSISSTLANLQTIIFNMPSLKFEFDLIKLCAGLCNRQILSCSQEIVYSFVKILRKILTIHLLFGEMTHDPSDYQKIESIIRDLESSMRSFDIPCRNEVILIQAISEMISKDVFFVRSLVNTLRDGLPLTSKQFATAVKTMKTKFPTVGSFASPEFLHQFLIFQAFSADANTDSNNIELMLELVKKINTDSKLSFFLVETLTNLCIHTNTDSLLKSLLGKSKAQGLISFLEYSAPRSDKDNDYLFVRKLTYESLLMLSKKLLSESTKMMIKESLEKYKKKENTPLMKSFFLESENVVCERISTYYGMNSEIPLILDRHMTVDVFLSYVSLYNSISDQNILFSYLPNILLEISTRENLVKLTTVVEDNLKGDSENFYIHLLLYIKENYSNDFSLLLETILEKTIVKLKGNTTQPSRSTQIILQHFLAIFFEKDIKSLLLKIFQTLSLNASNVELLRNSIDFVTFDGNKLKIWIFLIINNYARQEFFVKKLFPCNDSNIIKYLANYFSLPIEWISQLQEYKLFYEPQYTISLKNIYSNQVFSENAKLLIAHCISKTWFSREKAHSFLLELENLRELYDEDFVANILQVIKDKKGNYDITFINGLIKDMLMIEKLEKDNFSTTKEVLDILKKNEVNVWSEQLSNLLQRAFMAKNPERDINEVIKDFRDQQFPISESVLSEVSIIYQKVLSFFNKNRLNKLNASEISTFFKTFRVSSIPNEELLIQFLAYARQAIFLNKGYYPFNIQYFVVIVFLTNKEGKGVLAQVKTGQGKSIIVATLAAYLGVLGKRVDIVTTSENLAIRDVEEMRVFFNMFGLSVTHNCKASQTFETCYAANIVYGTPLNFEFAYLSGLFEKNKPRGNRSFDALLVDEVDSLFIDRTSFNTRIMHSDEIFLKVSWIYVFLLKFLKEQEDSSLENLNRKISFEPAFFQSSTFVQQFILKNLNYWLRTAKNVFKYKININFVIKPNNNLHLVDYEHTGEIHNNMYLQRGGHQLLEVKNNLDPNIGFLDSGQISHLTYFNFYKTVFGLSGTLGDQTERSEIKNLYALNCFDVPVHKKGTLQERPIRVLPSQALWFDAIIKEAEEVVQQNRCVLILFKSIRDTLAIFPFFENKFALLLNGRQKMSTEEVLSQSGRPKAITIATNIAGRGTDIKPSEEAEKNGGMHVILTFYPLNERVKAQAIGRTARQGRNGSYSFILNQESEKIVSEISNPNEIQLFLTRRMQERTTKSASNRQQIYVPIAKALDKTVTDFSDYYFKIRDKLKPYELEALNLHWKWTYYYLQNQAIDIEESSNNSEVSAFIALSNSTLTNSIKEIERHRKEGELIIYPEIYLARAKVYLTKNEFDLGIKDCKESIALDSSSSEAHFMLGKIFEAQSKEAHDFLKGALNFLKAYQDAENVAKNNLVVFPRNFKENAILVAISRKLNKQEQVKFYSGICKKFIIGNIFKNSTQRSYIGSILERYHLLDLMEFTTQLILSELSSEQSKDPNKSKIDNNEISNYYNFMGYYNMELKQYSSAEQLLIKALQLAPNHDLARNNMVNLYIEMGREFASQNQYDRGIAYAKKALEHNASSIVAYNNIGYYNLKLKQYKLAEQALIKALQLDSNFDLARKNMVSLYIEMGQEFASQNQYDRGIAYVKKALEYNADSSVAYNNIGYYQMELKQYNLSEQALSKALQLEPNYDLAKKNLATLYIKIGFQFEQTKQYQQALSYAQKAVNLNPNSANVHNNIGYYQMQLGNYSIAEQALRKALSIDPHYQLAQTNLNNLMNRNRMLRR
ncbi:MAG: tetratricopeptide repeat protein [Proteobacteria bacterium]|nr:tetratricopeptide repeat protein [Pseudomonadota bacterium]